MTRVESEKDSPTSSKDRTVRRKVLFSSVDKRKVERSSANRRQLKGKAKVLSMDFNQPSTSRAKEFHQFSLHLETDARQRKIIFMIKCTSKAKVVDVIVDGGSCENMVSEALVKQLKLRIYKVRMSYRMSWFKKGREISVKHRCLVPIQLKDYKDEV